MPDIEQQKDEKVVIVGLGWVGQANALALLQLGYKVFYYDVLPPRHHYGVTFKHLYDKLIALDTPLEVDGPETSYMVCVGDRVNDEGLQDTKFIEQALSAIQMARGTIILRSTIIPKTLAGLTFDYYIPEFLHEKFAIQECMRPYYFVLGSGTRKEDARLPSYVALWQERAQRVFSGTYTEASYIKYFSNMWNALRIAFVNELGDIVASSPQSESPIEDAERVINFLFEGKSYLRYGRGFGGHCLPKDMRAFLAAYGGEKNMAILSGAYESNSIHVDVSSGNDSALREWFSAWDYDSIVASQRKVFEVMLKRLYLSVPVSLVRHILKPIVVLSERVVPVRTPEEARSVWEAKAKENARYYVNQKTKSGELVDESEIQETGTNDYDRYVRNDKLLTDALKQKEGRIAVLDIGSGIGRMTESFAKNFSDVRGIDISPTMTEIAKRRLSDIPNVSFLTTDGRSIPFEDNTFDLAFSYQVFPHIDDMGIIENYLREVHRTLKPSGVAKIQLRTGMGVRRWVWSYGITFTPEEAAELASRLGFFIINNEKEDEKKLWLTLKK